MADWKKVEPGKSWNIKEAKANDSVEGLYLGKDEHVGENDSTIYHIQKPDGSVIDVWGTQVLDTRLKHLQVGEEIKIIYLGSLPSEKRKGKSYHNFEVYHRQPEMEVVE